MEIEYYETNRKECPLEKFLDSLSPKMNAKALKTIDLLERNGHMLREPYSSYIEEGIFEPRIKQSSNITRILYFFVIGNKAVLTHGFTKKTQKTPKSEIELAKKYRKDYERRH